MTPVDPQLLLLLDVETTGLDPSADQLCEVGAILFSVPQRAVLISLSFLLPVQDNPAEAINGITAAMTQALDPLSRQDSSPASQPRAFGASTVGASAVGASAGGANTAQLEAEALLLAIAGLADAFVAHNAVFDRSWLEPIFCAQLGRGADKPWICTCEGISWENVKANPSLQALALAHGIPVWASHRALTDCTYLAQILERCIDLEAKLQEGLEPRLLVAAELPFNRKEEAKEAGFRWYPEDKQWRRRLTAGQIEALPFNTIPIQEPA